MPVMYDLPDREDIAEVVINGAVVRGEEEPRYVAENEEQSA